MSDDEDYNSEEDLDYVPTDGEQVSEEENSGDEEDLSILHDGDNIVKSSGKRKKSGKKQNAVESRKRKGGIKLDIGEAEVINEEGKSADDEEAEEKARKKQLAEEIAKEEEEKQALKEKKKADDLWSSFMSDVKQVPRRPAAPSQGLGCLSSQVKSPKADDKPKDSAPKGKVTITKVFDFAGEEVKISKEVDANSKEAIAEQKKQEKSSSESQQAATATSSSVLSPGVSGLMTGLGQKRPAVGGLGSVLNKINKKNKMGTLEKSKIDWESFKKKEGIDEDLKIHNKGKQGYTERMAFLNRADQRQYEIERDLRLSASSKR